MKIDISWKNICRVTSYISIILVSVILPNWDKATFFLVLAILLTLLEWRFEEGEK